MNDHSLPHAEEVDDSGVVENKGAHALKIR